MKVKIFDAVIVGFRLDQEYRDQTFIFQLTAKDGLNKANPSSNKSEIYDLGFKS